MSDSSDPRIAALAEDFGHLEPDDQELVLALVARLRSIPSEEYGEPVGYFKPDVPFMNFDE